MKLFKGKIFKIAVVSALLICILIMPFKTFADECKSIRENILRLHILANSNSQVDQDLKIKVRDRVLNETAGLFSTSSDKLLAEKNVNENIEKIKTIAKDEITKNGFDYDVDVYLTNMFFATKTYDDAITLPAGKYDAVRVVIGSGEGKNWWCVMFPPLCLPAAENKENKVTLDDVLTKEQVDIATNKDKYEVKFAIVEFFEGMTNMVQGWFK